MKVHVELENAFHTETNTNNTTLVLPDNSSVLLPWKIATFTLASGLLILIIILVVIKLFKIVPEEPARYELIN